MRKKRLTTILSGFIIHPTMGCLGASPDGIAEFKCTFTKKDVLPLEASKDPSFYCTISNRQLHLERNHPYYHQVQLQLFVSIDMYHLCDFCIYTLIKRSSC